MSSPYTVAAHRRSGVWPQFAEAVFILGARLDGIRASDLAKAAYGALISSPVRHRKRPQLIAACPCSGSGEPVGDVHYNEREADAAVSICADGDLA